MNAPTARPEPTQARRPSQIRPSLAAHDLHRHAAGERDGGRDREVDVAGAGGDDEHLADADDHREGREGQSRGDDLSPALAFGKEDGGDPDRQRAQEGEQPGLVAEAGGDGFHRASRSLMSARRASTTISTAPCAPICQSGEMRMKIRNEPVRVSVTRADHRADRRDAAADELAAAQDHAGDRQQRVAVGDMGVRRGGEADQAEPGEHPEEPGQRVHQHADLEQRPAGAVDGGGVAARSAQHGAVPRIPSAADGR